MENTKFLVMQYSSEFIDPDICPDGTVAKIMTANEIFKLMDMDECFPYDFQIHIWKINGIGEPLTACGFYGTWHDPSDPLKMVISFGGERVVGYGTDH